MTLLDFLVDFARAGRIGPLHLGMPLSEAEDLLGPGRPHPAIRLKGPDIDGYPYSWDGLELDVVQRAVSGIRVRLRPGSTVRLPALLLPESESFEATVVREDLVAALDAAGCEHCVNDTLTFGEQSSILTRPAGVCAVFSLPGRDDRVRHRDRHHLDVIYTRP
ncbi:hypothetical protein [Streptomyces sp. 351MFTsu5.1]|uniref:hypothetical protein n=1 Tax=Streptomyces sp. 351MFTsu5.1 TaxID=1172180 RepID=UPI00036BDE06|nr:hypothetical protein [Streptomyces sp. 351MFTsu5.1]